MTQPLYKVDEGDVIELKCNSYGEVKWYYSGGNDEIIAIPTSGKILKLNPATLGNAGNYICYGSYPLQYPFLSRTTLEVFSTFVNNIFISVVFQLDLFGIPYKQTSI